VQGPVTEKNCASAKPTVVTRKMMRASRGSRGAGPRRLFPPRTEPCARWAMPIMARKKRRKSQGTVRPRISDAHVREFSCMHREAKISLRRDRPLPPPNQGEVSQIQPRRPGMRDCVGGGAGSLTQAVLHRVDFPFWVCHDVIMMSRNKRAPQVKTVLMTHVSTCMSQAFFS